MEVFIATADYEKVCPSIAKIRRHFRDVCVEMWRGQGINPIVLLNNGNQRERHIRVENLAHGEIYISTADDCLPDMPFEFVLGKHVLSRHPDVAIAAARPFNEQINAWTPEGYTPLNNEHFEEHFSVGHISFIRNGAIKEWPEQTERGYDTTLCEYLRTQGWKVGFIKGLGMTHLGKGLSSI